MDQVLAQISVLSMADQPPELLQAEFATADDVLHDYKETIVNPKPEPQLQEGMWTDEIEAYWAKHGF